LAANLWGSSGDGSRGICSKSLPSEISEPADALDVDAVTTIIPRSQASFEFEEDGGL